MFVFGCDKKGRQTYITLKQMIRQIQVTLNTRIVY